MPAVFASGQGSEGSQIAELVCEQKWMQVRRTANVCGGTGSVSLGDPAYTNEMNVLDRSRKESLVQKPRGQFSLEAEEADLLRLA